jgi:hypothetical protein
MKSSKIKYLALFLSLCAFGFLAWERWNSYPKVELSVRVPEQYKSEVTIKWGHIFYGRLHL